MGADLILAGVVLPNNDKAAIDWHGVNAWCRIAPLEVLEAADEPGSFEFIIEGETPEERDREIRDQIIADFEELRACIDGKCRNADVYKFGETYVAITGGTSFGDDPSYEYDAFCRIAALVYDGFTFPMNKENA